MEKTRIKIKNSLFPELFALAPTKAHRTQIRIIEAAIKNYVTVGIENTTYESIARTCALSRGLVQHYFPDKEEIFVLAVKYIRGFFQQLAIAAIEKETGPVNQLKSYVQSTFDWFENYNDHTRVWGLFFYYCGIKLKYRNLNTELVNVGHQRIQALLELGNQQGVFKCKNTSDGAKLIQAIISGALITLGTENATVEPHKFVENVKKLCLEIAGV